MDHERITPGAAVEGGATRISREQVRKIQAVRHARKIDDETWADMKRSVGVASTLDLTQGQYRDLMRRLTDGWVKKPGGTSPKRRAALGRWMNIDEMPEGRRPLLRKLMALLLDGGKTWAYADGIARKMYGVDRVEWCDPHQLHGVVQALSVYKGRHAGRGAV